jgi:hypothetical protein
MVDHTPYLHALEELKQPLIVIGMKVRHCDPVYPIDPPLGERLSDDPPPKAWPNIKQGHPALSA